MGKITNIEKQKHNSKRFSVYVDDVFEFGLSDVDILFYKLKAGDEISDEKLNEIKKNAIFSKARDKAFRLLSFGSRTESELKKRLSEDYDEETIEKVIALLKRYDYINDKSYARGYINDGLALKKKGRRLIKYELFRKGVSESTIDEALDENSLDELSGARELLKKRLRGKTSIDYKEKKKHFDYLLRRGFDYETIKAAFNEALTEETEWSE